MIIVIKLLTFINYIDVWFGLPDRLNNEKKLFFN